ncbi:MAG: hypothetical protein AAF587_02410 [Bacteroidota bacterium]
MMKRKNLSILTFVPLLLLAVVSCSNDPVFPLEPRIEFLDIHPKVVTQYQDSIIIRFRFQDGDGDLGAIEEGDINLRLIDSRVGNGLTETQATLAYSIPNLTPDVKNPSIQGEIKIKVDFTIVLPGFTEQEIRYQIKFEDRAGNLATPIEEGVESAVYTDYITIVR